MKEWNKVQKNVWKNLKNISYAKSEFVLAENDEIILS